MRYRHKRHEPIADLAAAPAASPAVTFQQLLDAVIEGYVSGKSEPWATVSAPYQQTPVSYGYLTALALEPMFTVVSTFRERIIALTNEVAALKSTVAALEQQHGQFKYCGVWEASTAYRVGNFTTHSGSLWHADRESTGVLPGSGGGWTLCVKRGRDAKKDARDERVAATL